MNQRVQIELIALVTEDNRRSLLIFKLVSVHHSAFAVDTLRKVEGKLIV